MVIYNKIFRYIFNRPYEEYVSGIGKVGKRLEDEFFIGLQRLHLLTNGVPHEVILLSDAGMQVSENFVIGNRSEGYMVKSTGKCTGDRLFFKKGTKFSTFDRDEDGDPARNLAKELKYGWWFDSSLRCVLQIGFFLYSALIDHFLFTFCIC